MWYLMATEKGGVLFPEEKDPLTRTTVTEGLDSKYPSEYLYLYPHLSFHP